MPNYVDLEVDNGVAVITLNRPEHRNALDKAMSDELEQAWVKVGTDQDVRVVILTGAGDSFTAGGHMDRLQGLADSNGGSLGEPAPEGPHRYLDALVGVPPELRSHNVTPVAIPVPVVAAINGACAGIGLAQAAACDIRFMSDNAFITAGFPRVGLIAEAGLAHTLPRIVGNGGAAHILFSGRKIKAQECLRMGFASEVLPQGELMPFVLDYAREMASSISPRSARVMKRQLRLAWSQSLQEAMQTCYAETVASFSSEDFAEGVAAFIEKRTPKFSGK